VLRVLVVDLDVHQGNGTAAIFRDDPTVFTFSMHGGRNFPFRKEASDLDVDLPDGCADEPYLQALDKLRWIRSGSATPHSSSPDWPSTSPAPTPRRGPPGPAQAHAWPDWPNAIGACSTRCASGAFRWRW
jgi:hypothetical protein